jgi:excisionase family DNA binding protein
MGDGSGLLLGGTRLPGGENITVPVDEGQVISGLGAVWQHLGDDVDAGLARFLDWLRETEPGGRRGKLATGGDWGRLAATDSPDGVVRGAAAFDVVPKLLTFSQVAALLFCDVRQVQRLVRDGELHTVQVHSRSRLIPATEVNRFIERGGIAA